MKEKLKVILNIILSYLVFMTSSIGLHEMGHALMGKILGFGGVVVFGWGSAYYQADIAMLPYERILMSIAGGGFVVLVFGLLLLLSRIGRDWDEDDLFVVKLLMGLNAGYALAEAFFPLSGLATLIGILVGAGIVMLHSLPPLAEFVRRKLL